MQIQLVVFARRLCALFFCLAVAACGGGDGGGASFMPVGVAPGTGTIAPVIPPVTESNCKS